MMQMDRKDVCDMTNRLDELLSAAKLNELLHKKEEEEKKQNCLLWALAIIGAVAVVAGIAYAVYRYFTPNYLDDFEDDFEDDFDDDFFDDEEGTEKETVKEAAKEKESESEKATE